MKKICFVAVDMTVIGGAETVAYDLAQTFADKYDVSVLGIQSKYESPAYQFSSKIKYSTLGVSSSRFREMLKAAYSGLQEYLKKNQFDVVFLEGTVAGFVTFPHILRFRKTKFIFCDHGALINEWDDRQITLMRRIVSFCAKKTVVLTERTRNDYRKLFHLNKKKVSCIPNGINKKFEAHAEPYDCESKRMISVGRFGKEKGYDMAIEVAKIIFSKYPDWKWDFYGDGETFSYIQEKVKEYGLEEQVLLHGSVSDTSGIYANHALLVLPSYREGLPLVLLEAKANHLPCVSFDVLTGPREVIRDGENGFLIPMYDIVDMAEKIGLLIENKELRKKYAENTVLDMERFQKDNIEKQWIQMIETK